MKNSNSLIILFNLLMIMSALLITTRITAQQQSLPRSDGYSDEELKSFLKAAHEVLPLQQESQVKMIEEIERNDFTLERFNVILESHSRGEEVDASGEEIESFSETLDSLQEIQLEYEDRIISAIEYEGLTTDDYQMIFTDYQRNPELEMRVNALMEKMVEDGEL
jgi:DNA repair ATPase RecN